MKTWEDVGLEWGSHLPALMACVAASSGPVLEIGAGHYSTPCLHAVCAVTGRALVTVEGVEDWRQKFMPFASTTHHIMQLEPGLIEGFAKEPWGVVFVDDAADARVARAEMFFDTAQFMLFHDYNFPDMKPPLDAWMEGKNLHARVYDAYGPHTLIVSKNTPIPAF